MVGVEGGVGGGGQGLDRLPCEKKLMGTKNEYFS